MAENLGKHSVIFENATTETVTFVTELTTGSKSAFTLFPHESHTYIKDKNVHIPLTHEELRLVVGKNSNGRRTEECVSTEELRRLSKVVVTSTGTNFVLKRHPSESSSSLAKLWQWFSRS